MTRDREVNLGNLNDVTVDDHGDAGRRPSSAGSKKPSEKAAKPPKTPKKPAHPSNGGGGGWMIACLVLVVLIAVMGVWFQPSPIRILRLPWFALYLNNVWFRFWKNLEKKSELRKK